MFIPYFVGAILLEKYCQKWEGLEKRYKGRMAIWRGICEIGEGAQIFSVIWSDEARIVKVYCGLDLYQFHRINDIKPSSLPCSPFYERTGNPAPIRFVSESCQRNSFPLVKQLLKIIMPVSCCTLKVCNSFALERVFIWKHKKTFKTRAFYYFTYFVYCLCVCF